MGKLYVYNIFFMKNVYSEIFIFYLLVFSKGDYTDLEKCLISVFNGNGRFKVS